MLAGLGRLVAREQVVSWVPLRILSSILRYTGGIRLAISVLLVFVLKPLHLVLRKAVIYKLLCFSCALRRAYMHASGKLGEDDPESAAAAFIASSINVTLSIIEEVLHASVHFERRLVIGDAGLPRLCIPAGHTLFLASTICFGSKEMSRSNVSDDLVVHLIARNDRKGN